MQLERICAGGDLTLLVVEHDMHFIGALCEEVIVLDFGRKIAEGTPEEISPQRVGAGNLSGRAGCRADGAAWCSSKCMISTSATAASTRSAAFR
jgi:energy-coupling factor transporter ATP-binding protein EcfA2